MYDIVLSFVTSFILSYVAIPAIISISRKKHLFDEPNHRTSHVVGIPTLGGLAIFAGMLVSIILWTPFKFFADLQYILGAVVLLFLIGAKDDIDPVSPIIKFVTQICAAGILVFMANIRITTLYSIFGVGELPFWISILLSIFVIVALINAFNLIDGVNGLAGTISVLSSLAFGYWFFIIGKTELAIVAVALAGSVIAFLRYNYSPAKIFMGDAGSLLLGIVASILAIQFIEINKLMTDSPLYIPSAPAMAIAILIIPIFDTARVMVIRLLKGNSPFKADKLHVHHLMVELGLSHMQTTLILMLVNLLFIGLAFKFRQLGNLDLFFLMMGIATFLSLLLQFGVKFIQSKKVTK